ncbi:hypothetical protein RRG08_021196 [Elysia crispata]|uniref:Uncharacterized protein n=1 Tax=Elysia crispata TaxID=231223 RepID=A0AAE0YP92_9GAST|nr:hypothetical protein RRG08_021196 [Elysia crispata]
MLENGNFFQQKLYINEEIEEVNSVSAGVIPAQAQCLWFVVTTAAVQVYQAHRTLCISATGEEGGEWGATPNGTWIMQTRAH